MDTTTSQSMRSNARICGEIFHILALLALLGTFVATVIVSNLGSQIGITATHNPVAWSVLIGGLVVTFIFFGLGYILGMLCAIYDRQEPAAEQRHRTVPDPLAAEYERRLEQERNRGIWQQVAERQDRDLNKRPPLEAPEPPKPTDLEKKPTPPHVPDNPVTLSTPSIPPEPIGAPKKGLWAWLTRERHILNKKD